MHRAGGMRCAVSVDPLPSPRHKTHLPCKGNPCVPRCVANYSSNVTVAVSSCTGGKYAPYSTKNLARRRVTEIDTHSARDDLLVFWQRNLHQARRGPHWLRCA